MKLARNAWRVLVALALLILLVFVPRLLDGIRQATAPRPTERGAPPRVEAGDRAIAEAYAKRRSGVWVESEGVVERLLADDDQGSRHQRFIVRITTEQTVLFAHNIDLAPRVPLQRGDAIRFRGEYEWNDRGGVIHWTHDDPENRRGGGWIEHRGQRYR